MPVGKPDSKAPGAPGPFEFATAGRIVFGTGASAGLPDHVAAWGRRVLWVTGSHPDRHAGLEAQVAARAVTLVRFSVAGEPTVALAEEGARLCREQRCEVVVALGGGSVLDAGKAIAALAANTGPALDYLEVVGLGRPLPAPALPCVAVPTTAGTGSEVTRNAVLAVPSARVKVSLRHVSMLPRVALVDPALALDLPPGPTASTGLDALTQLIEPFLCSRANALTDALCRDGIPRAARALRAVARDPRDLDARSDLALAALYSGMALANAGLGAVHGFAAPIGGGFPAPHGAVCAALLPHVLAANHATLLARAPGHPAITRFDELGRLLTGRDDAKAADALAWCTSIAHDLGTPPLAEWGIERRHLPELAAQAARSSSMKANPIALTQEELEAILDAALAP